MRFLPPVDYIRHEVWGRKRRVLLSLHSLAASALGVSIFYFGSHWALAHSKLGDVLVAILSYAAIAFGFSLAGLTLALALPDIEFVTFLAKQQPTGNQLETSRGRKRTPGSTSSYSNLLFVFSWTAVAHWLVIMTAFSVLAIRGFDAGFLTKTPETRALASTGDRASSAFLAGLTFYALLQFGATVVTLAQVGRVYVAELAVRSRGGSGEPSDQTHSGLAA